MTTPVRVTVLGGGSWGTTVASIAAKNRPTLLWARDVSVVDSINREHINEKYLKGLSLNPSLRATNNLEEAVRSADVLVVGVPSHSFRKTLIEVSPNLRPWVPVVSLSKGLEPETNLRMTQIIEEVLPSHPAGLLAGPNIAREVLQGFAAASVIAMRDEQLARALQPIFGNRVFRVYTNTDVVGCELGGPLKNVIAIAAGMADGLGVGTNTLALVIARGLAEITRLGCCLGGRAESFSGLTGLGDLIATCMSPLSRNRQVGVELAKGRSIEDITKSMHMVAEGVRTAKVVMQLAEMHGIQMPIAEEVAAVVRGERSAEMAYRGLRQITPGSERDAG